MTSDAERLMETVADPKFKRACEIALLEYVIQRNGLDPRDAYRILGAKEVLNTLLNLGLPYVPQSAEEMPHLQPT